MLVAPKPKKKIGCANIRFSDKRGSDMPSLPDAILHLAASLCLPTPATKEGRAHLSDVNEDNWLRAYGIPFGKIPTKIIQLAISLSGAEFKLAVCLAHEVHWGKTAAFSYSLKELRDMSGLSNGSVQSAILGLQKAGVLVQEEFQLHPREKNKYRWNVDNLREKKEFNHQFLARGVAKNWRGSSPKFGEGASQNLASLYIEFFLDIIYISFREYFTERDECGNLACFVFKPLPKKGTINDGEDSPSLPLKRIPRLKFWELSIKRVLKDGGYRNPMVHIYSVLMLTGDVQGLRFPYRYLKVKIAEGELYHQYKKMNQFPVWLESDAALLDYIKTDPIFNQRHKGGEGEARSAEVH